MTDDLTHALLREIAAALDLPPAAPDRVRFSGGGRLSSCFPVTELAAASIGAACLAVSELTGMTGDAPDICVDHRLASLWFGFSIHPQGWALPSPWDAVAGDYRARDGWIKLHTNAPRHKAAALQVLATAPSRDAVAAAVATWEACKLEEAVLAAGGCAAALRTRADWAAHAQGRAVAAEPLVIRDMRAAGASDWRATRHRPLAGLRVLDLTRVLAGPVATRFLAGYGADVLRIDPPGWDEPGVIPEVTLGKRCARLDLREDGDRGTFERLLAGADILVHGYRPGALDRLGYGAEVRQTIRPGLVDVSLDAYGHGGPWAARRGFDSLVQFSSGICADGMAWRGSETPVPLPVQALDQATGYLIAAAAVRGVAERAAATFRPRRRLSLARTAALLIAHRGAAGEEAMSPAAATDLCAAVEDSAWGPARRLRAPARIAGADMLWTPATALGSGAARWRER